MDYRDKKVEMTMGEFESAMKANITIGMFVGVAASIVSLAIVGFVWWLISLVGNG